MKKDYSDLIDWLRKRPLISILALERAAEVPEGALNKAVKYDRSFNKDHLPKLAEVLKDYGYRAK